MSKEKVEPNNPDARAEDSFSLDRRSFMKRSAIGAAGMMLMQPKDAMAGAFKKEKDQIEQLHIAKSEHVRPNMHADEIFELPRWLPSKKGNYNLNDPDDNFYAWAKCHAGLMGEYNWLNKFGWICFAPPGIPAYPFLGRMTVGKYFCSPASADPTITDDHGPDDYITWAVFATIHVDPRTFKPLDKIYNPYTDKTIDLPEILYADRLMYRKGKSIVVPGIPQEFYNQPWDEDGGYSQHYIDSGQDVAYTVLGSSQHDGAHQPRIDIGFWNVDRKELMDASNPSIECRRDYSATMKASEYPWYGVEEGDQSQLVIHMTGKKVHSLDRVHPMLKTHVIDRFPERFKH